MKIDAPVVRSYLIKAFRANLEECYSCLRMLGWQEGYLDRTNEVDQALVPITKDTIHDIIGHVEEQFDLSEIPNEKYNNAEDLRKHLDWFRDHLAKKSKKISDNFVRYKKQNKLSSASSGEPPIPFLTAVNLIEKYVSISNTALSHGEYAAGRVGSYHEVLINILSELDRTVRAHKDKRRNESGAPRATIEIVDEYDVQDLLYAILHLHFQDIRKEEPIPSFGPSKSRCDLLLASENIFIEIKTALKKSAKEIFEDFKSDIPDYLNNDRCKELILFVHDPLRLITNRKMFDDLKHINVKGKSVKDIIFTN